MGTERHFSKDNNLVISKMLDDKGGRAPPLFELCGRLCEFCGRAKLGMRVEQQERGVHRQWLVARMLFAGRAEHPLPTPHPLHTKFAAQTVAAKV